MTTLGAKVRRGLLLAGIVAVTALPATAGAESPEYGGGTSAPAVVTGGSTVPGGGESAGETNLPFTGGDVLGMAAIGAAAAAGGLGLAVRRRRRTV